MVGGRKGAGNTSSVGDMLSELEWPSLETRREQSSLTFFYKILSGTVYIDKDKYLTSALGLKLTRATQSHDTQYCRYLAYSDALKNLFFPRTILYWNSLPFSAVGAQTADEFKALIYSTYAEACVLAYLCLASCK